MSAAETAIRVIRWAAGGAGPMPRGDLRDAEVLAEPPKGLLDEVGSLLQGTAGRLRWEFPILGDPRPPGVGVVVLAAALGASDPSQVQFAGALLLAVEESDVAAELVVRHGLLAPTLDGPAGPLDDEFRRLSPLTALLDHPAPGQEASAREMGRRVLADPSGRPSLVAQLASPTADAAVRRWQADLLDRFRLGDEGERAFVLDVYETAMIHHRDAMIQQVREARAVLTDPRGCSDERRLVDAMAVAEWWGPLWALHRQDLQAVRLRKYLHHDFLEGLRLFRLRSQLTGGAA